MTRGIASALLSTCFSPKLNRGAITVLNQQYANVPVSVRHDVLVPHSGAQAIVPVITRPISQAPAAETSCGKCHLRTRCLPSGLLPERFAQLDHLTRAKRKSCVVLRFSVRGIGSSLCT